MNETVKKCYKPVNKVCDGKGEDVCRTVYESNCDTRYVEKSPNNFVADTACEKLPLEVCGKGCTYETGEEECHEKLVASFVDIPEEICDLNPQKTCHFTTKLVPKLEPVKSCTKIMKESCHLTFSTPKQLKKPLLTKWCLEDAEDENNEDFLLPVDDIENVDEEERKNQQNQSNFNGRVLSLSDDFGSNESYTDLKVLENEGKKITENKGESAAIDDDIEILNDTERSDLDPTINVEELILLPQELEVNNIESISNGKNIDLSTISDSVSNPTFTEQVENTDTDNISQFGLKINQEKKTGTTTQPRLFPNRLNASLFDFLSPNSNIEKFIGPKLPSRQYDNDIHSFQTKFL